MSGLFDFDWRTAEALDRIASITDAGRGEDNARVHRLRLKGEDTGRTISDFTYQHIIAHPLQLVPAEPGIYALHAYFETGVGEVGKTPVIAWARCFDGSVRIVTPAGVDDGHLWKEGQGYVWMPDGSVQAVGTYLDVTQFDNVDEYLAYQKADHNDRQEVRA